MAGRLASKFFGGRNLSRHGRLERIRQRAATLQRLIVVRQVHNLAAEVNRSAYVVPLKR